MKEKFGSILSQKLKRASAVENEAGQVLAAILGKAIPARDQLQQPAGSISLEYLALQTSYQEDYYRNLSTPDDPRDKMIQSLAEEAGLLRNHSIRHGTITTLMSFENGRKHQENPTLPLGVSGSTR